MVEPDFKPLEAEENILRWYLKEQDHHSACKFMQKLVNPFNYIASMQEQNIKRLRGLLDKETLCTLLSTEKTAIWLSLERERKHMAELDSYREEVNKVPESDDNPHQISVAKRTYLEAISYRHAEKEKHLRKLEDLETLAERLAKSSASDNNYPETKDYLRISESLYQVLVDNTPAGAADLSLKKQHLSQLQEAVAVLTEHITAEDSIFPISRETYLAAAEQMDCYASEKAYELRCAEVAPSANEIARDKRKKLEKLKEKISFLFQSEEIDQK